MANPLPRREPYGDSYHRRPWGIYSTTAKKFLFVCWEDCELDRPTRFWTEAEAKAVIEGGGYPGSRIVARRMPLTVVK